MEKETAVAVETLGKEGEKLACAASLPLSCFSPLSFHGRLKFERSEPTLKKNSPVHAPVFLGPAHERRRGSAAEQRAVADERDAPGRGERGKVLEAVCF